MADIVPLTAFKAIQDQIKTLCLRDFPCGTGSWHKTDHWSKNKHRKYGAQVKYRYEDVQLDIDVADMENSDQLIGLITDPQSPWYMDYSWSKEAHSLKETAIKSPWLIQPDFIYSYFRTLNVDDKSVTEIDEGLLRLKNLEEITLSANYIKTVNSSHLPASLKVLELCANDIDGITDLCNRPPPLLHLGLGRNRISSLGNCISGAFWPELVSLDLSYNDLCGLTDLVKLFSTLPKLRNLILQGNPVSLISGYRGYVIDSLPNLTVLDDKQISVDEKYSFNGLATLEELVRDEALVQLGVISLKGVQCPPEIMYPDSQPDYPVIERTYFVQFMLPRVYQEPKEKIEDRSACLFTDIQSADEITPLQEMDKATPEQMSFQKTSMAEQPLGESTSSHHQPQISQLEKNPLEKSASKEKQGSAVDVSRMIATPTPAEVTQPGDVPQTVEVTQLTETEGAPQTLTEPVNCSSLPWDNEMLFNWTRDVTLGDLLTVRDFFRTGMDVHVMEQTVEAYPPWAVTGSNNKMEDKGREQKDKKKPKEPEKGKERSKKKAASEDFLKGPPKLTNIASFHVPLDDFLNGELEYKSTFTKINVLSQTSILSKISEEKIDKKADKKKTSLKSPALKKDRKKSPQLKEGRRKHGDEILSPSELQLVITIKLGHWQTALDAIAVIESASLGEIVNTVAK